MSLNSFSYSLPAEIGAAVKQEIASWNEQDKIRRIWERDASVWTGEDEADWLGWLTIVDEELADAQKFEDFRAEIENAGFSDVLLMGMGGSSLCPEVLAKTFGRANFHILDSTVPARIKAIEDMLDLEKTLFIVASKSGSTLEPNCFKQYFFDRLASRIGHEAAGKHFVAITDPGSKMEQVGKDDGFRNIFYGKPSIGGRFSALSAFGLAAAASMGIDVRPFLKNTGEMVAACGTKDVQNNPGALLGAILGVCHEHGRDKLTIFTAPEIHDLGAWLEQLIAESTGKNNVAIIPVDREPIVPAVTYGEDRVFAFLNLRGNAVFDAAFNTVAHHHSAVKIELETKENLGQEFFRWEFATAVAGSMMRINPFNQPDVEAAKVAARSITDKFEETGELPGEAPFYEQDGVSLFSSTEYAETLVRNADGDSLEAILRSHIDQIGGSDYFALLAYIEMSEENATILQSIRKTVLERTKAATCLGFGPRFLHSTGQAYKGGPNTGVFLQITSDDAIDLKIPGQKYTFGVVRSAQAMGDFQVLLSRGRRALRLHLGSDVANGLKRVEALI